MAQADGLKKLRAKTGKVPTYDCPNCKCKRYSKCGCMKGMGYIDQDAPKEAPADTPEVPETPKED